MYFNKTCVCCEADWWHSYHLGTWGCHKLKIQDSAGNRTQNFPVTSQVLRPLSLWVPQGEEWIYATCMYKSQPNFIWFSVFLRRYPLWIRLLACIRWLYRHTAWADTLTIHHHSRQFNYLKCWLNWKWIQWSSSIQSGQWSWSSCY